ncbi:class III lanthipeptide [Streptomyces sp. DSM 42041]|uniref:Class III lanthipeptide n=1 Tax=Streptomyces hazeniae TaxID=3075538 RepID=A0ABU2NPC3_9ACTN|nr:class III lanthipeptide [Streptomyces sp. DSM 42041]MDT0378307.1 class III lanthipeptide [Streptomyces sp. DSM 42041]
MAFTHAPAAREQLGEPIEGNERPLRIPAGRGFPESEGEVIRVNVLRLQNLQPRTTTHTAGVVSVTSSFSDCCNRPVEK